MLVHQFGKRGLMALNKAFGVACCIAFSDSTADADVPEEKFGAQNAESDLRFNAEENAKFDLKVGNSKKLVPIIF